MDATERTEKATKLVELWEVIAEDDPAADNLLRAAQVHATLALAEQQRIANLIALAAHEPGNREAYWRTILSDPLNEVSLALKPEIRSALGLI